MIYFLTFLLFYFIELLYFYIAKRFNIVDIPNNRSSHTEVTIRGGGIIIWMACLIYSFTNKLNYPYFIIAISLLAVVSFWDDRKGTSKRIRFLIHFLSLCIVLAETNFMNNNLIISVLFVIFGIGMLNGFNFMDGINGITVAYSLVSILSFLYVEKYLFHFVDAQFLIVVVMSLLVFGFYNFRIKAKTFAGDVGSISIAFVFIFLELLVYHERKSLLFLFFFIVYGIDVAYTLIFRLSKGQNIFEAHRLHLFQLLKNEMRINPLWVSSAYALVQLFFNIGILLVWNKELLVQVTYVFTGGIGLILLYIVVRMKINSHNVNYRKIKKV